MDGVMETYGAVAAGGFAVRTYSPFDDRFFFRFEGEDIELSQAETEEIRHHVLLSPPPVVMICPIAALRSILSKRAA